MILQNELIQGVKQKILEKFDAALENPLEIETVQKMGEVIARFEENEIISNNQGSIFDLKSIKDDIIDIISMLPKNENLESISVKKKSEVV